MTDQPPEHHHREQYFFDTPTLTRLADLLEPFERPCLLCCPMLGRELVRRGRVVTVLELDERFADLPGFRRWDLARPEWLGETFDVICCDPPFFGLSLTALRRAIDRLARHDPAQPLMITYLARREDALLRAFARYQLAPLDCPIAYATVVDSPRNAVRLYGNLATPRGPT